MAASPTLHISRSRTPEAAQLVPAWLLPLALLPPASGQKYADIFKRNDGRADWFRLMVASSAPARLTIWVNRPGSSARSLKVDDPLVGIKPTVGLTSLAFGELRVLHNAVQVREPDM